MKDTTTIRIDNDLYEELKTLKKDSQTWSGLIHDLKKIYDHQKDLEDGIVLIQDREQLKKLFE